MLEGGAKFNIATFGLLIATYTVFRFSKKAVSSSEMSSRIACPRTFVISKYSLIFCSCFDEVEVSDSLEGGRDLLVIVGDDGIL